MRSQPTNASFIIPAIDIIDGKCVRLTQGDFGQKKIYSEKPLEVAKGFEGAGLVRLHLVDLDGARSGTVMNWKVLEEIASNTNLTIDFGGGIRSLNDVTTVLDSGASMVTIGSIAIKDELMFDDWILSFGIETFLLGADVKDRMITYSGWQERSNIEINDFIEKFSKKGINQFFCTDVGSDGLLGGPAFELYKELHLHFPGISLIASGGVRSIDDVLQLRKMGCSAVIVGKAIYEGRITLDDILTLNES